jgi:hypothetical protein
MILEKQALLNSRHSAHAELFYTYKIYFIMQNG